MVRQKLYLLAEKCNIIVRNCGQSKAEDVLADMGDFTNTITGLIPDVQFFGSAEFLNTLQKLLLAMTKPDMEVISSTIQKSIIPVLEKMYREYETDNREGNTTKNNNSTVRSGAASDAAAQFDSYAVAARRTEQQLMLWEDPREA